MTDADLAAIGVAPCTGGGGHCRCVENQALIRAYRKGRADSAPPERAILQDLITESRSWLKGTNPMPLGMVIFRAEARLREVQGE